MKYQGSEDKESGLYLPLPPEARATLRRVGRRVCSCACAAPAARLHRAAAVAAGLRPAPGVAGRVVPDRGSASRRCLRRDEMPLGLKRNFQVMPGAQWLTLLYKHIPDRYEHLVRTVGGYSNRARGERAKQASPHAGEWHPQWGCELRGSRLTEIRSPLSAPSSIAWRSMTARYFLRLRRLLANPAFNADPHRQASGRAGGAG